MTNKEKNLWKRITTSPNFIAVASYALLAVTAVFTLAISAFLYSYTQTLLEDRLFERMTAIASTSSLLFKASEINSLIEMGAEKSLETSLYKETVLKLRDIKEANEDITYAYIYSKTDNPNIVKFVADADVIALRPDLNYNEDETTDEGFPGSEYDVSDIPLIYENVAFEEVVVDVYFYDTIWGKLMTTYAPIKDRNGEAIATLAIDVDITDFNRLVKATYVPFGVSVVGLLFLLLIMTLTLIRMWGTRVEFIKELDRQKDELLSIVSHQLATPVSSMKWYLEMMLDGDIGKLTKEQTEHVESLQFSAANLSDLVSMILDVSRIQLGRMKIDRTDLDTDKFFKEVAKAMDPKATEQGVELVKDIQKDLPVAMLDIRLMRMTLENLLSNAVKYTPKGGKVTLSVKVEGNNLVYKVQDTGCGIPKQDHDKMFGKLFRASNVGKIDGNGFGLYVAKGAVEAQGGKISFESTEGKGTIFKVILPVIKKTAKNSNKKKN